MKKTLLFSLLLLPLALLAQTYSPTSDSLTATAMTIPAVTQPSNPRAQAQPVPAAPKLKVVYHNIPVDIVSGARIDAGRQKIEIIYAVGNVENHIYVASQTNARRFNQNPPLYMQKLAAMEQSLNIFPTIQTK